MVNQLRNRDENPSRTAKRCAVGWWSLSQFRFRFLDSNRFWVCRLGVLLAMVSILLSGCDAESAKWDLAKAKNLYQSNDLKGAIELLEKAHQRAPQDNRIKLELALRYAENGQGQLGIGLCNEYLKQFPDKVDGFGVRSSCWLYLGKFDEALADYKLSLSEYASRDVLELNGLAYYRGLADKEIDRATIEIQGAVERLELALAGKGVRIPLQIRTVVAAGLVSRSIGQQKAALSSLDPRIEHYEKRVLSTTEVLKTRVTGSLYYQDQLSKKEEEDLLGLRRGLQGQKESLTAMLVTRALILEDLGQQEKADQDRWAVEELDFDFEQVSNRFPSDLNCLRELRNASMFLDTRGFVLGRQRWKSDAQMASMLHASAGTQLLYSNYREAMADMDLAILAADFEQLGLESSLCNSTEMPTELVEKRKKENKRKRAVLLHHRKEIHLREGNKALAELDQKSIDELGFNDSSLF